MKLRTRMLIERLVEDAVQDTYTEMRVSATDGFKNDISKKIFAALDAVLVFPTTVRVRKAKK